MNYINEVHRTYQRKQLNEEHLNSKRMAYVEALVDINVIVIETIWSSLTVKESQVTPVVPLRTFIQEVLKRSRITYSTLQTALFYLFRAQPALRNNSQMKSWQHKAYVNCGRRMFLASLVVASKFVQDKTYRNSAWAKIAGLSVSEINTAEQYFLSLLDYRLYIDQSVFDHWHQLLHEKTTNKMHRLPTSLHDISFLSFAPRSYPPSPVYSFNELPSFNHIASPVPSLTLSLPSSISSSPAQTPSPVRTCRKRKYDKEHMSLLDKKHCRFWQ